MNILLLRIDSDGNRSWGTYTITHGWEWDDLFDDLKGHLNTVGVSEVLADHRGGAVKYDVFAGVIDLVEAETGDEARGKLDARLRAAGFELHDLAEVTGEDYPLAFESEE